MLTHGSVIGQTLPEEFMLTHENPNKLYHHIETKSNMRIYSSPGTPSELCIHITRADNSHFYIVAIVDNEDAGWVESIPPS